jgi:hypothetical protein
MTFTASASGEAEYAAELYPNVAAVASVYGDADGKYASYLKSADRSFASQPYFFWNQPFAPNEGGALPTNTRGGNSPANTGKSTSTKSSSSEDNGAAENAARLWPVALVLVLGSLFI